MTTQKVSKLLKVIGQNVNNKIKRRTRMTFVTKFNGRMHFDL